MDQVKDQMLHLIEQEAAAKVADLSSRYFQAPPAEKETIQAAIEIERWLAQSCADNRM